MSAWQIALAVWFGLLGLAVAARIQAVLARERRERKYAAQVIARMHRPATRDITPDPQGLRTLRHHVRNAREEDTTP